MLGITVDDLLPSLEKEEETIRVENEEVKLNDISEINACKELIDKINSLT